MCVCMSRIHTIRQLEWSQGVYTTRTRWVCDVDERERTLAVLAEPGPAVHVT